MTSIGWKPLLITYLVVAGLGTVVLRWFQLRGSDPLAVPPSVIIVLLLIAGVVLFLGLRVRRWVVSGTGFDPIGATRTLALAQAAAIVGAMQAGYFTAQIITVVEALPAPEALAVTYGAVAAAIAALVLVAAGLVAQWSCRVPPEDEDPSNPTPTGGTPT